MVLGYLYFLQIFNMKQSWIYAILIARINVNQWQHSNVIVCFSGHLQPAVMFSIKPFQLGRGPSCSAFRKILALRYNISTASSGEDDGRWLIRSLIGVNWIFDKALNTGWVHQCNFTPTLFATTLLFVTFASLFTLWSGAFFSPLNKQ